MAPPISIAMPCWRRADYLARTLESIRRQNYPGELELIVVEDDRDGLIEKVAAQFEARYLTRKRTENYPIFQSVAVIWNMCLRACSHEITILQTDDIVHESSHVIEELVERVQTAPKLIAMPLIKALRPDGSFHQWYSHPAFDGQGARISGTGPHTFFRSEMLKLGGYEEMFYGYGYDDNYIQYLWRKNGWTIDYVESAMCAHPFHEHSQYGNEKFTVHANRALIRTLVMEIEDGLRKPIANSQPLQFDFSAKEADVEQILSEVRGLPRASRLFAEWEAFCWRQGNHPDRSAQYSQNISCERPIQPTSMLDEMIVECAWGLARANLARVEQAQPVIAGQEDWPRVVGRAADITHTWASRALGKARFLIKERKCLE